MNNFLKSTFHSKVFKVSLNGGFTCPNKDGTSGVGGCTFCSPSGSGDFAGDIEQSITEQFHTIKEKMRTKWPNSQYIAYFQANTNTYGSVDTLKNLYDEALRADPNIVGLSIATRADALSEATIDLLETYHQKTYLQVELGLQSIDEDTAKTINRGHDLKQFDDAVNRLRSRGINVVVHIINGFPWEDKKQMIKTIEHINALDIQGVKIHMLHITKNTALAHEYLQKPFELLDLHAYVDVVVEQIRRLHKNIVIQRVTGDASKDDLIAPMWTLKKFVVMNEIDKLMRKKGLYQGDLLAIK